MNRRRREGRMWQMDLARPRLPRAIWAIWLLSLGCQAPVAPPGSTVINDVRVIDPAGGQPVDGTTERNWTRFSRPAKSLRETASPADWWAQPNRTNGRLPEASKATGRHALESNQLRRGSSATRLQPARPELV